MTWSWDRKKALLSSLASSHWCSSLSMFFINSLHEPEHSSRLCGQDNWCSTIILRAMVTEQSLCRHVTLNSGQILMWSWYSLIVMDSLHPSGHSTVIWSTNDRKLTEDGLMSMVPFWNRQFGQANFSILEFVLCNNFNVAAAVPAASRFLGILTNG